MINKLIVVAATAFCPAIIIILSNIYCINTSQKFYRQFFFRSAVSEYGTRQNRFTESACAISNGRIFRPAA